MGVQECRLQNASPDSVQRSRNLRKQGREPLKQLLSISEGAGGRLPKQKEASAAGHELQNQGTVEIARVPWKPGKSW